MTDRKGTPPKPGSKEWAELCKAITEKKGSPQPFCGQAGGKRRDGWPCESVYVKGNGLCKMHGGSARKGALAGPWKHGRDSAFAKVLPSRFRAAYEASLNDENLLSLRSEIALADVRTYELLEQLSTGESGEAWGKAKKLAKDIRAALKAEELERATQLVKELEKLSQAGVDDEKKWAQLRTQGEHRRKLADTERQRMKELNSMIGADEALTIVARLVDIVMKHVPDSHIRADMLYEFEALVGHSMAEERRARFLLAPLNGTGDGQGLN